MENNYEQINLEQENCDGGCDQGHDVEAQMEAIRKENQGIMTVAFSLTAICSAIIAGSAVSAAIFL
jgi:hypothetical protein